jgi:hypothetical protein
MTTDPAALVAVGLRPVGLVRTDGTTAEPEPEPDE